MALPFQELVNQLHDKQKKLGAINKALDQYMKEKVPLEELIKTTEAKIDNMEPAGLDVAKDEADLKELEVSFIAFIVIRFLIFIFLGYLILLQIYLF